MGSCSLLVLVLVASAVGARATASDDQSHLSGKTSTMDSTMPQVGSLFSQRQVSMQVVEQAPRQDDDARVLDLDETKLSQGDISEMVADLIAKQLKDAGVSAEDLAAFIANQTAGRDVGDEQFPDSGDDQTSQEPSRTDPADDSNGPGRSGTEDDEEKEGEDDKSRTSARHPRVLSASAPASGGPDVFNNGTDYFKWLEDIMKQVEDKMAKKGNTADDTAMNERPPQSNDQSTRGDENTKEASSLEPQGLKDWQKSEDAHGGFDNIPKAVPMIVMSGNTYIKDIGNFRNTYTYGQLPLKVRTLEPNGNDSGLKLDDSETNDNTPVKSSKRDGNTRRGDSLESSKRDGNTRRRDSLESSKRDGNTRRRDSLESSKRDGNTHRLRSSAPNAQVRGHDDRTDGHNNGKDNGQDSSTYHSQVHGHDDGDSRGDNGRGSSTYHSEVHGHDDGDSRGDNGRGSSTYHSEVHGHDDGDSRQNNGQDSSTYHSEVHGHDDGDSSGDSRSRNGQGQRMIRGHDDGGTNSSPVHGHDDGGTNNSPVHGHDDGGTNSPFHGHDDGGTNNSPVHGHDDGGANNSPVHGHDDGGTNNSPVHGHDDGGTNNSPGHGHDDGETNNSPVHGHDDGETNNSPVHGHNDGGSAGPLREPAVQTTERRNISMTMTNVSLAVLGCAVFVLGAALVVHRVRKSRLGPFRRADYIII
ncbi:uncharacterized protein DDB_G0290685-like isoform X2 [Pollicipes pollicipes]|uniref:uncharacterized protein DDB_G0290685-like isoform X2 n=1 Tax=Pollicipes pollicipes TaxID=41117 RepID=UPI0018849EBB|nr:uncharacterized protein DDB_G0290685-like isoform X2 [Pollicipes pollicipes]